MLSAKLKEAAGNSADATLYVDDVFSTWLYTGTDAAQTITNGIDLAGKGGLVWGKSRSGAQNHRLYDTARGSSYSLISNDTAAQSNQGTNACAFNSDGFSLSAASGIVGSAGFGGPNYVSWTFREAAKFFDVVTYTGNGNGAGQTINHNLGVIPGLIICKSTSATGDWAVCARTGGASSPASSITYATGMSLNSTAAALYSGSLGDFPTATTFSTAGIFDAASGGTYPNINGVTYVAYLFAHDTSSTGIIQCGSFTSAPGTESVTLGWEPQWLLYKRASPTTGAWAIADSMRGVPTGSASVLLSANTSAAEAAGTNITFSATGFSMDVGSTGDVWIYMAIRMPNKPPTTGTQVFSPNLQAGGGTVTTNFPVDLTITTKPSGFPRYAVDRLRGSSTASCQYLVTNSTAAEVALSGAGFGYDNNTGYKDNGFYGSGETPIYWNFKRAPGFFDEVCYTGDGVASRAVPHNLTSVPELIIFKTRNWAQPWIVYSAPVGATKYLILNQNFTPITDAIFVNTTPTASVFYVNGAYSINSSGVTVVSYLFATLAGISKVGSYTGNGTGQAIACGFGSSGARFVLIKRTDSTGNWYTFDSARGLTSGSSPYLLLNSTAAEVTGNNGVYASSGGFTLGATAITTTNIATATYIFLAVA